MMLVLSNNFSLSAVKRFPVHDFRHPICTVHNMAMLNCLNCTEVMLGLRMCECGGVIAVSWDNAEEGAAESEREREGFI